MEISEVRKSFGSVEALDPIDLTIEPGETVTPIGPSGCGKTTLLHKIAGLEAPTSGSISVYDEAPQVARRSKQIGFVPQSPAHSCCGARPRRRHR